MFWYNKNPYNYNSFIIFLAKHFCPKNFIFTLNSLIIHKWILMIKNIKYEYVYTWIKLVSYVTNWSFLMPSVDFYSLETKLLFFFFLDLLKYLTKKHIAFFLLKGLLSNFKHIKQFWYHTIQLFYKIVHHKSQKFWVRISRPS